MGKGREAILALADGRIFRGRAFGAIGEAVGEVVFNTAMTGYQEVLTDPSYKGQLVCMTYPEIGNVGINAEDAESRRVYVEGFIVKEYWERPSNWRSEMPLGKYLEEAGVVGIEGIDTRALVRHLRTRGAQEAVISSVDLDPDSAGAQGQGVAGAGRPRSRQGGHLHRALRLGLRRLETGQRSRSRESRGDSRRACDRRTRLRNQAEYSAAAGRDRLSRQGDAGGVQLRSRSSRTIPTAFFCRMVRAIPRRCRTLTEPSPAFWARSRCSAFVSGIRLLGLALGGKTYKLDFGHHGANHPVMDLRTRRVEITSQNHGFAVNDESLKGRAKLSHLNLNDNTVEGLQGTGVPFFSVQYHPEASPGPHDSSYLFARFRRLVETFPRYGAEALERIIAAEAAAQ